MCTFGIRGNLKPERHKTCVYLSKLTINDIHSYKLVSEAVLLPQLVALYKKNPRIISCPVDIYNLVPL